MLFSVVVPVFNRENLIGRCIASVLAERNVEFELVLVDDGSTDASLACMREFDDPRLRIIAEERNRGASPARNIGIDAARGDWVVSLDSDDELAPGALGRIASLAAGQPDDIDALWFRCRMDDGQVSPGRLTAMQEWDYAGFVGFWQATVGEWRDMLYCSRRRCHDALRQPAGRMDEAKYLLDFAKRFRIRAYPDVLRLYHQDADNQLVDRLRRLDPLRDRDIVLDRAACFRDLLREHGAFVARQAPKLYRDYLESAATTATMANLRGEALARAGELVRLAPGRSRSWVLLGASLMGLPAVHLRRWMTRQR